MATVHSIAEYQFGFGQGWLSEKGVAMAESAGARAVNTIIEGNRMHYLTASGSDVAASIDAIIYCVREIEREQN